MKKTLVVTLLTASMGAIALPAAAADIVVRLAPPEPRVEVVPAPRRGYTWTSGYWDWRRGRHVWVAGHWVRERPGYRWHESRWEERDGRWYMRRGGWDRDGDGVPNRYDSRPDNPNRQ